MKFVLNLLLICIPIAVVMADVRYRGNAVHPGD